MEHKNLTINDSSTTEEKGSIVIQENHIYLYDRNETNILSEDTTSYIENIVRLDSNGILIGYYTYSNQNVSGTVGEEVIMLPEFITMLQLDKDAIASWATYGNTTTEGSQLMIDDNGVFCRYSSSSKRYKENITTVLSDKLNPHKLYDLDVVQFQYKDGYLKNTDQRYQKEIIGLIAEDIYEKYPIACNLNKNGQPEVPEYNMLIAPMLKLIQEQHEDIEALKTRIQALEETIV